MRRLPVLNTLKQRFFLILGVSMSLCLFMVIMVSYVSMRSVERTRLQTSMLADLHMMGASVDDSYYSILQISQQMMSVGSVGSKYNTFLTSLEQYDRIVANKEFEESISLARFGGRDILIAAYVLPDNTALYTNFSLRKNFDLASFSTVLYSDEISFHGVHQSQSSVVDKPVVSVSRPTVFENGTTVEIYLEAYTDVPQLLSTRAELESTRYTFAIVDEDGRICYSSSDDFAVGDAVTVPVTDELETRGEYAALASESQFGFSYMLFVPQADYNREMNNWKIGIFFVALLALLLLILTAFLLIWLIWRPVKTLEHEMAKAGDGDLSASEHRGGIREFDELFAEFNRMKTEIQRLILRTREQDKENYQLELDKLSYQINPHFLMNTLNTAHWMALANGQQEIDQYINQLNYILGYSLGKTENSTTLRTELKALKMYLELQQKRYDFAYHLEVEEGAYLDRETARLILQPIAENAVCHNMDEFGNLWVTVRSTGDTAEITVRDDGKGFRLTPEHGESRKNKGIGLRYVRLMLESFYNGRAEMTVTSEPGQGTTVVLRVPLTEN